MNLTHELLVIAVDPRLLQRLPIPEEMRRHVLQLELVDEGDDEGIDIPLRNFMKNKNSKKPKKK